MIFAYTNTDIDLVDNEAVPFNFNGVDTCHCDTAHTAGSPVISIKRPGFYKVDFNADLSGVADTVTFSLVRNGVVVPGAEASVTTSTAATILNVSFSSIIRVAPNCCVNNMNLPASLQIVMAGGDATISNAAITVSRV